MSGHGALRAVIPSLRQEPQVLRTLLDRLTGAGVSPCLVVTGHRLHERLTEEAIPHITPHDNPGFAATVHFGAENAEWDWLFLVNDDITLEDGFADVVADIRQRDADQPHLVFIDNERRRPLPHFWSVFSSVSLIEALAVKTGLLRGHSGDRTQDWYKSFSCVAISRSLWDQLGGLDTRFPYTYEDADFTRRARAIGAEIVEVHETVVRHAGSGTSRRFIGRVLPVGTFSARRYLESRGHPRSAAVGILTAALVLRLALAPVANADLRDHVKGIITSLRSVGGDTPPRLPVFEEN